MSWTNNVRLSFNRWFHGKMSHNIVQSLRVPDQDYLLVCIVLLLFYIVTTYLENTDTSLQPSLWENIYNPHGAQYWHSHRTRERQNDRSLISFSTRSIALIGDPLSMTSNVWYNLLFCVVCERQNYISFRKTQAKIVKKWMFKSDILPKYQCAK